MKILAAFVLGAIAGVTAGIGALAIAAAVDQQRRDPLELTELDAPVDVLADPYLEVVWSR